ncbi:MAG: HAD-IIA family hydrolase [Candidatus Thermoplasmatota archaeon]|jgi:4-nitrophenyl phosphatase|nr:HAD-IIA family hydrolase [Candidatus Thermoplasmatota archaeon]
MIHPRGVILDLDGTLRRGSEPIPGAVNAVRKLLSSDIRVCYLTNNSTRTGKETLDELMDMGFPEAPMVCSSQAASLLLKDRIGSARCLVVGEQGLLEELRTCGHRPSMAGKGAKGPFDAVVAGLDRAFDYGKLSEALDALRSGALFIATNEDPTLPIEGGGVRPGAGAIIHAIRTASGMVPLVAGKPEPHSTLLAVKELGCIPREVMVIGDRADMDALAGKRAGCMTALVMTGEKDPGSEPEVQRFDDISSLVKELLDEGR